MNEKIIWTIGHSTHSPDKFLAMLQSFRIELVVDIRSFPGSRRFPQFNSNTLAASLRDHKIEYIHLVALGGRRKPREDSTNNAWRIAAFRGYADYMETDDFKNAVSKLEELGKQKRVAYMCAEAVWWRCHRSLVSDFLKNRGWTVMHIMDTNKEEEHPYTSPARVEGDNLTYRKEES